MDELDKICTPIFGCCLIWSNSSSVNLPSFCKILSGTPIFPISWNRPPTCNVLISSSERPSLFPIKTEISATLSECPLVYISFASIVWRNVSIESN